MYQINVFSGESIYFEQTEESLPLAVSCCLRQIGRSNRTAQISFQGMIVYEANSEVEHYYDENGNELTTTQVFTMLLSELYKFYPREEIA